MYPAGNLPKNGNSVFTRRTKVSPALGPANEIHGLTSLKPTQAGSAQEWHCRTM